MNYRKQIGRVIRFYREAKDLSEEELGELVGVSQQQINRYELGKTGMTVDNLIKISELLDIPVMKFFEEIKINDFLIETKNAVFKRKAQLDIINNHKELQKIVTIFGKNAKNFKDIDVAKLLTKLSKIAKEDRSVTIKNIFNLLK